MGAGNALVGAKSHRYEALRIWEQLPRGWNFGEVAGVATDSRDRVFVFNRGEHPVIVFDRGGGFLTSWGEGSIRRAHGIHIGPDDAVYLTDDLDHTVRKFTPDGKLLLTLGNCVASNGDIYVTDGYGNARVHKFAPDGRLLSSWGEPGDKPGQFNLPHGIAVDSDERVYVADRENSRIQVFTQGGELLAVWTDVARPMQVFIDKSDTVFVAEVGFRAGLFPWQTPPTDPVGARLSIFDRDGKLLTRWGGGADPTAVGDFFAPHDVWVDSRGDLYVGEVTLSAGGNRGLVSPSCHSLQKFVRL
jgi:DNA-binding beta-propeller fold protein YncE